MQMDTNENNISTAIVWGLRDNRGQQYDFNCLVLQCARCVGASLNTLQNSKYFLFTQDVVAFFIY